MHNYTIHEYLKWVPETGPDEYAQLKDSIAKMGQQQPIITHEDKIIDGRTRLKVCLELGIEPRFAVYNGALPVAQYILVSNTRRNLSKAQRHQMLADFAPLLIVQVDAEMAKQRLEGLKIGSKLPGKAGGGKALSDGASDGSRHHRRQRTKESAGNVALADATGATIHEVEQLKSIHKNAPEMLKEVGKNGGLWETGKKARAKAKASNGQAKESVIHRQRKLMAEIAGPLKGLTPKQVDPDFKGGPAAFTNEYGFVHLQTKAQRDADRDATAFTNWIGALRQLAKSLSAFVQLPAFSPERFQAWLTKIDKRSPEMQAHFDLLKQASDSVEPYRKLL